MEPIAKIYGIKEKARRFTVERKFKSHFKNIVEDVRIQIDNRAKVLNVYGNVSKEELDDFMGKLKIGGNLEYLKTEQEPVQENNEGTLYRQVRELETGLKDSNQRRDSLEQELSKKEEELQYTMEEWGKLDEENKRLEVEKSELEAKIDKLETKEVKDLTANAKNAHDLVRPYLAGLAKRMYELEAVVGRDYESIPERSAKEIFEDVEKLGLKLESGKEVIKFFKENIQAKDSNRRLGNLYDEENKNYQMVIEELDQIEESLDELKTSKMHKIAIEGAKKSLKLKVKELEKEITEYEEGREEFVVNVQESLPKLVEELEDSLKFGQICSKVKKLGCNQVQVFLDLNDNDENYFINMYLPLLKGKKSGICNSLIKTWILDGNVRGLMKDSINPLDKVGFEYETNSNLAFSRITLSKERYSFGEILGIVEAMTSPEGKTYHRTMYSKIGVNPNMVVSFNCTHPNEEIEYSDDDLLSGMSFINEKSRKVTKAVLSAIPKNGRVKRGEVMEKVESKGLRVKDQTITKRLRDLKEAGIISSEGTTSSMVYFRK